MPDGDVLCREVVQRVTHEAGVDGEALDVAADDLRTWAERALPFQTKWPVVRAAACLEAKAKHARIAERHPHGDRSAKPPPRSLSQEELLAVRRVVIGVMARWNRPI